MSRDVWAEAIGSFFLFCTVIGSGIMADRLAGGRRPARGGRRH